MLEHSSKPRKSQEQSRSQETAAKVDERLLPKVRSATVACIKYFLSQETSAQEVYKLEALDKYILLETNIDNLDEQLFRVTKASFLREALDKEKISILAESLRENENVTRTLGAVCMIDERLSGLMKTLADHGVTIAPTRVGQYLRTILHRDYAPEQQPHINALEELLIKMGDFHELDIALKEAFHDTITRPQALTKYIERLTETLRIYPKVAQNLGRICRPDSRLSLLVERIEACGLEVPSLLHLTVPEAFPEYSLAEQQQRRQIVEAMKQTCARFGLAHVELPSVQPFNDAIAATQDRDFLALSPMTGDYQRRTHTDFVMARDHTKQLLGWAERQKQPLPFRCIQYSPSYRAERVAPRIEQLPRSGRFMEFWQFDIDYLSNEALSLADDAEVIAIAFEVFRAMGIEDIQFRITTKSLLPSILAAYGIPSKQLDSYAEAFQSAPAQRQDHFLAGFSHLFNRDKNLSKLLWKIRTLAGSDEEVLNELRALKKDEKTFARSRVRASQRHIRWVPFETALNDLETLFKLLKNKGGDKCIIDCGLVRGCDIYSGPIFEAEWLSHPELGSVAGGGRYDKLAGELLGKQISGTGLAIGASRIFDKLLDEGHQSRLSFPCASLAERPSVLVTSSAKGLSKDVWDATWDLRQKGVRAMRLDEGIGPNEKARVASLWGVDFIVLVDRGILLRRDGDEFLPTELGSFH